MNRSCGLSKNSFIKIFVSHNDLPDFSISLIGDDLDHPGQLVGAGGCCLVLQQHHVSHLAVSLILSPPVRLIKTLKYDGFPFVPKFSFHLLYKLQPASKVKCIVKIHLGGLN
jgi:hypothetical protein